MSNPASYLSQPSFDPRGHSAFRQVQVRQAGPGVARPNDQLVLFRCAAQMMATGALTDDQAKTLSRLLRQSAT
jgi:hypothetical protein